MSKRTSSPGMRWAIFLVAMSLVFLAGCQHAMSSSSAPKDSTTSDFPLRFTAHNFGAYRYNTYGCKVLYNNFYHKRYPDDFLRPPPGQDSRKRWDADYGDVPNFPPSAIVTWTSLDGVKHEEKVDIAAILKNERILHLTPEEDIPQQAFVADPSIILVVDDQSISVYMRAHIPLKKPAIPGNKYSTFRDDLVLAYTHVY